jgi:hypothetical protein
MSKTGFTDRENYSNIIKEIFDIELEITPTKKNDTNNVIGALNYTNDYDTFRANFIARLKRLKFLYNNDPNLITQIKLIADSKNWEGAYAELVAYDKLNKNDWLLYPIQLNVDVEKDKTFMAELGGNEANLDGYIKEFDIYFDVKCFKDNVMDILKGIYKDVASFYGFKYLHISEEYKLDKSFDDFQSMRKEIFEELKKQIWENIEPVINKLSFCKSVTMQNLKDTIAKASVEQKKEISDAIHSLKQTTINSKTIRDFSFKILWDKGVLSTMRTYHVYRHAKNSHKLIFNYAKKFHKERPSLIVLVTFPWYNQLIHTSDNISNSDNKLLYRSISRRVFCQYIHDNAPFSNFNSKFSGVGTIYEVSKNLSGIIFLEDNAILSKTPDDTNVKSYVYLNPNAKNPLKYSRMDFIHSLHNEDFDDFEYDNY